MSGDYGIEKIGIYAGRYYMKLEDLAEARGLSATELDKNLLVRERSVFPAYEDTVTMAANAADPILTEDDRRSIGLLIAATETSLDQEKALSSWIHDALELRDDCRNFEVKHACMGATDAIRMATSWLGAAPAGRKALVVTADRSLLALGEPWEPINGGAGAAVLLSDRPNVIRYDGEAGLYTRNITDVIRPDPRLETGNSQESLFGYLEALDAASSRYFEANPAARDALSYFVAHLYHVPFAGITYRAHRYLLRNLKEDIRNDESWAHFSARVLPALEYNRRIGASYGGSLPIALTCLLHHTDLAGSGDRVSFYSYGSGCCGEFYSAIVGDDARANVFGALVERELAARKRLTVDEYESFEREADSIIGIESREFDTPACELDSDRKRLLVLSSIRDYVRSYEWIS